MYVTRKTFHILNYKVLFHKVCLSLFSKTHEHGRYYEISTGSDTILSLRLH